MSTSGVLWVLVAMLVVALLALSARMRRSRTSHRADSPRARVSVVRAHSAGDARQEQRPATDHRPTSAQAVLEEWRAIASERRPQPRGLPSRETCPSGGAMHRPSTSSTARETQSARSSARANPPVRPKDPLAAGGWLPSSGLEKKSLSLRELETTLNYGAVRVRVEEARMRLINKVSVVCTPDPDGSSIDAGLASPVSKGLDADVAAKVDSVFFEEKKQLECSHRPRSSSPGPTKRAGSTAGTPSAQQGKAHTPKRAYWRVNGVRRPRGPLGRRRATVVSEAAATPSSWRRRRSS